MYCHLGFFLARPLLLANGCKHGRCTRHAYECAALLEAETLQRLQHTAVVGYRDTFVDDEYLCLVMEYADSGDLGSRIAANRERPFGEEQVLQWLVQLALALHHVHERGVLHRDLKTQNVFLTAAGHAKLGDFGIARVLEGAEPLAATCEFEAHTPHTAIASGDVVAQQPLGAAILLLKLFPYGGVRDASLLSTRHFS